MAQRADFVEILEAMDALPVTVRLLDPPLHEFLPDTGELAIKEATVGLDRRGAAALRGGQGVARVQPDARHPGRAPRGGQARPLRHAGAGPHGGGPRPGGRRRAPGRRDHDPPDRRPARRWPWPARGWRPPWPPPRAPAGAAAKAARPTRPRPRARAGKVEVLIGTMIETPAGRAAGRRDRRGGRLLLLRHQRPDPDDLRLQPRRRRGPDDGRLPGPGPAASATRSR